MKIAKRVDLSFDEKVMLSEHIHKKCLEGFIVPPSIELIMGMPGSTIDDFYNDHEYDPEDTSIDSSEFSSWIGDLSKITKTYAMMIESLDLNENYYFKNYQSLFQLDNKLTSLLSV